MGAQRRKHAEYRRRVSLETLKHLPEMMRRPHDASDTIDHIVPISYGWKRRNYAPHFKPIPPDLIGGIDNLAWSPLNDNIGKGTRLTDEAKKLLTAWGYEP